MREALEFQTFLNDRHADEPMARFNEITKRLAIAGYNVSGALRYPFFIDCLKTRDYLRYSRMHYFLVPAGWRYMYESADVLFVQEGDSEREKAQILPIVEWLKNHGRSAEVWCRAATPLGQRVWTSIETSLRNKISRTVPYRDLRRLDRASRELIKEFKLSRKLTGWLRMQALLAFNRFERAKNILEEMKPEPKAIVVNSEYHPISRAAVEAAHALHIPTVLIQHGFLGQQWLHWPVSSEKVCIWGEVDKDWYAKRELADNVIEITGSHKAFPVEQSYRNEVRKKYGLAKDQHVIIFFAPNLEREYHARASRLLKDAQGVLKQNYKWFVRPHPSQTRFAAEQYGEMTLMGSSVPLKEAFALADLILHDFSTMAFAQFAGLETACLALDGPYPDYYAGLLGKQKLIASTEDLCDCARSIKAGYELVSGPVTTMAAGGDEAIERVGRVIMSAGFKES